VLLLSAVCAHARASVSVAIYMCLVWADFVLPQGFFLAADATGQYEEKKDINKNKQVQPDAPLVL
jgi:hypothetical protein